MSLNRIWCSGGCDDDDDEDEDEDDDDDDIDDMAVEDDN